jgi:hypothetical protein
MEEGLEEARVAQASLVDVNTVVRAAGGLVRRPREDGVLEIAIVHRRAHDDWAFAKSKLHPGEVEDEAGSRSPRQAPSSPIRATWSS